MATTSFDLPQKLEELLEYLTEKGYYSSKSEAIRNSLRQQHSEILAELDTEDTRVKNDE